MRALVTGGAGFIGSHVADSLLQLGDVLVLDDLSTGSLDNVPPGAMFVQADITDAAGTAAVIKEFAPDVVAHLAAQTRVAVSVDDPQRDAAINVVGTITVLQAAAARGCRKFIFASSSTVYGIPQQQPISEQAPLQPISPYGVSKLAGEHYVRVLGAERDMRYTVLRLGNVYGPRDSLDNHHAVTSFMDALINGAHPVVEWDGRQSKDYVYVRDVADAVAAAVSRGDDRVFNVASERAVSVADLLDLVCTALGVTCEPLSAPKRPGDVRHYLMDCSAARDVLGWVPRTSLADGLAATAAWYSERLPALGSGVQLAG